MMPAAVLLILAAVVVVATALALAGRWRPRGLDPQAPPDPARAQFDVVLRGYRMEQVDAEIARLHALIEPAPDEVPTTQADPTMQEWPSPQSP